MHTLPMPDPIPTFASAYDAWERHECPDDQESDVCACPFYASCPTCGVTMLLWGEDMPAMKQQDGSCETCVNAPVSPVTLINLEPPNAATDILALVFGNDPDLTTIPTFSNGVRVDYDEIYPIYDDPPF